MNTVLIVAPKEKRGSVMGLCGAALTLGLTVAGIVLQFYSWHALFIILIAIILIAIIVGSTFLVNVSHVTKRQMSLKEPMLNLRCLTFPVFTMGTLLVMLSMMTVFTMSVMLPMFVQGALGANSFVAAMTLLPATLISGFLTPVAGKLYDKIEPKVVIPIGFAIILIPLFILAHANYNTSLMTIVVLFIIVDIGIALTMSPSQTTALSPLPREYYPHGVAILNTLQQLSAAIGSSLFIGIMSATQLKALSNQVQEQTAAANGFSSTTLVL